MLGNNSVCCSKFVCHAYAVCQQTVPCAKHRENLAQQSHLFAAVIQCRLWADDSVCWAYGDSVPYPEFCCAVSRISEAFWPPVSLFWLTITVIQECSLNSLSSPSFRVADTLGYFLATFTICFGWTKIIWNCHQIAQTHAHTTKANQIPTGV